MIRFSFISLMAYTLVCLLTGCGYTASNYSASVRNIEQLRITVPAGAAIRVSEFESPKGPIRNVSCRLNPMTLPGDSTYEDYIREAMINELRLAGVYAENSNTELRVLVDTIDSSSSLLGGNWNLKLTLSADGVSPFTVEHKHEFRTGYDGDMACERVGTNLVPAVQGLIGQLFNNGNFQMILRKSAGART